MAKVWNPTEETIRTKAYGNHFEFKPGAMKSMNRHVSDFIAEKRRETGLVVLPPQFGPEDDNEEFVSGFAETAEGKAILAEKKKEGISALIKHHSWVIQNNQVSLKRDLAHYDPSNDPKRLAAVEASDGELESMRIVAKYKKLKLDEAETRANEVEKLLQDVGPLGK